MGAIVVNRLLAESIHLDRWLPVKRIVYLAPASSINDVAVINHFRLRSQGTRFWTFALQRSDETWESHWLSPRGSLLVWIDNYFETVVERGDARYGRTASYRDRYSVYFEWKKPLGEEIFNVCEWSSAEDRPKTHHAVADPKYLATALWHIGKEVFESQVSPGTATDAIVCANRAIAQDSVPTAGDVEQAPLTSAGQREDAAASIPASRE